MLRQTTGAYPFLALGHQRSPLTIVSFSRSGITDFGGGTTYLVRLGLIGRDDAPEVNESIASYIPGIGKLFESGHLLPSPYVEIGAGGFGAALEALEYQKLGSAGSKKVVVKLQEI